MKTGDYVAVRDPKCLTFHQGDMRTILNYACAQVFKVHDHLYVTVILPNGVKQKIPRGRCLVISDKDYFKLLLKGKTYQ